MPCYAMGNQTALHHHAPHRDKCTEPAWAQSARILWSQRRIEFSSTLRESSPCQLVLISFHDMLAIST